MTYVIVLDRWLNALQRGGNVAIDLLETLLNAMWIGSFEHVQMYP